MQQESYGDLVLSFRFERFASAVRLDWEHNLDVTARVLLNEDFTFCPIYDFNSLRVAWSTLSQPLSDSVRNELWPTAQRVLIPYHFEVSVWRDETLSLFSSR